MVEGVNPTKLTFDGEVKELQDIIIKSGEKLKDGVPVA